MRKCTSLAPASRIICTILVDVVPRTIESSTSTKPLPSTTARLALCLRATRSWRTCWVGAVQGGGSHRVIGDDAELVGDARLFGVADSGGHAGIGNRNDHISVGARLAGELRAHGLANRINRATTDDRIWAREVDVFENTRAR